MILLFSSFVIISVLCILAIAICYFSYSVTASFLSWGGWWWCLYVNFNSVSVLILLMLLICFVYAYNYTNHYFGGASVGLWLNKIICLFVAVMASLVCTGDFLLTLVFWEYLGVVSFFLILFYGNYLSLRSSIITLVSSRFGDVCLFLLVGLSCYLAGNVSWAMLIFFLIVFTKSAGFPFISWLLEAMRAPTPVSSLVHSSTLVAAGVWFVMRYDFLIYFNSSFLLSLFLLITIIVTGLCCYFFIDLKKIVALSTCNNISWCIFYLIFGDCVLSLFQLISHGVSKCMLFMLVGDVMSGVGGSQNSNCVYSSYLYGNWGSFSLFSVILGLSGAPFIGVFFTKHFLLTNFMNVTSISLYLLVLGGVFLSYFYSFRLCVILISLKSSVVTGVLYFFNIGLIIYFWLFINYFVSIVLEEVNFLSVSAGVSLLLFQLLSCVTVYFFYTSIIFSKWSSSLFGCDNVVELFYFLLMWVARLVGVTFYRWDSYTLSLFSGVGVSSLMVYATSLLNTISMIIFLFLMCYIIIY